MTNLVDIVFPGYSFTKAEQYYANCSCTLVRMRDGNNIIIDTMTAWDGERIQELLKLKFNLTPDDIHYVICTHGHSDHTGCNYLFQKAKLHIVGTTQSNRDLYKELSNDFCLCNGELTVTPTPGHTHSCVSVIVKNSNYETTCISGDLFECEEDIHAPDIWLDAGSENPVAQRLHRLRMAELCKFIIPGHGGIFEVTKEMRQILREDLSRNVDV